MSNKPRLTWEAISLKLHRPFRLSTGGSTTRTAHWIRLEDDQGWGEGTIPPYYNVKDEDMWSLWENKSHSNIPFPDNPADISSWVGDEGPAPARAALDLALHDRLARSRRIPVHTLLNVPMPAPFVTAFTISIDEPEKMAQSASDRLEYPVLKLKAGSEDDIRRVAAVREARPEARIFIDANAGWTPSEAIRIIQELQSFKIELIEQPVAGEDIEGLGEVQRATEIPIVADESLTSYAALEKIARVGVRGINLKIMKLGGLSPTLELLKRGRSLGLKIMLGCMTETSLGVSAMSHLTALADWHDLDAPLLISNDPFDGIQYDHAQASLPDRVGIGVVLRN